jgi:hypothetical protein
MSMLKSSDDMTTKTPGNTEKGGQILPDFDKWHDLRNPYDKMGKQRVKIYEKMPEKQ